MSHNIKYGFFHISLFIGLLLSCVFSARAADKPVTVSLANMELAASLQEREEAVSVREKEIELREQRNRDLEKEIDTKLAKLTTLQQEITETQQNI